MPFFCLHYWNVGEQNPYWRVYSRSCSTTEGYARRRLFYMTTFIVICAPSWGIPLESMPFPLWARPPYVVYYYESKNIKLCGKFLNCPPGFPRVSRSSFYFFRYWLLPLIVRCGWAWLFFNQLASSHRQFISNSRPRRGGGLDWQKIKADCCKSWSSFAFCVQRKHFGGGRRLFYQTLV